MYWPWRKKAPPPPVARLGAPLMYGGVAAWEAPGALDMQSVHAALGQLAEAAELPDRYPPVPDQRKMRITKVGTVRVLEGSVVEARYWRFWGKNEWAPTGLYETTLGPDLKVAGWHLTELHAIAHGEPCDCGLTEMVERYEQGGAGGAPQAPTDAP
jgi:hypothetical protein